MKRARHKHNYYENKDRLSDLPNCLLLHILSFLNAKRVVQTCILSKRWKNIWKSLHVLRLSSSNFKTVRGASSVEAVQNFNKFMSNILSLRDYSASLHTLDVHRYAIRKPRQLKWIIKYAVSHNVQHLNIYLKCHFQQFPPCLFSSRTLTSLKISVFRSRLYHMRAFFPNSLNLPALTTLSLQSFTFLVGDDGCTEPFSALKKLNSLIIDKCEVLDSQNLCISSTTLVNLTIIMSYREHRSYFGFELSAPSLCTFNFSGLPLQKLCRSNGNLSTVKHVSIDVDYWVLAADTPLVLLNWLVELANIKSLTVTSTTLKVLSLVPDLLKFEFSSLCNLKSLKVKRKYPSSVPDGLVDFLLQNTPLVEVDIVD
ncbi:F-box/FBD/LRR-repeat protein At3g26920-like [Vicia villosa]|uniref:F-box/FBD/LRR-repeat protein At3g26920-like n=1 Tax=Vicia villosa TaxID=3911 RepID=UPI00273C4006|nr:F-box/FBD/LRR-repeat protein At3g26920-like [Vicia villosa]